jgi:hypothetical protein
MTSTNHFNSMTNISNIAVTKSTLMQAASLAVMAVVPLAVGVGLASMSASDCCLLPLMQELVSWEA